MHKKSYTLLLTVSLMLLSSLPVYAAEPLSAKGKVIHGTVRLDGVKNVDITISDDVKGNSGIASKVVGTFKGVKTVSEDETIYNASENAPDSPKIDSEDTVETVSLNQKEPENEDYLEAVYEESPDIEIIATDEYGNEIIIEDNDILDAGSNEDEPSDTFIYEESEVPIYDADDYYIPLSPYTEEYSPEPAKDVRKIGGSENIAPVSKERQKLEYPTYLPGEGETELLAKLIWHEAGNQPYEGRVAVAEVVMNRVFSYLFPDNILEVIYQPKQFSYNEEIEGCPVTEENLEIARMVIEGEERIFYNPDVLYYRNCMITSDLPQSLPVDWEIHTWYGYIKDHAFYTQY